MTPQAPLTPHIHAVTRVRMLPDQPQPDWKTEPQRERQGRHEGRDNGRPARAVPNRLSSINGCKSSVSTRTSGAIPIGSQTSRRGRPVSMRSDARLPSPRPESSGTG